MRRRTTCCGLKAPPSPERSCAPTPCSSRIPTAVWWACCAPSGTHLIVENDEHTYPSSIAGATASIVSSVIADYPVPVDRLTQDEKMEIMDALNRKGVFLLKGSVSHVARELHSSEASIYRYLGKLNNKD